LLSTEGVRKRKFGVPTLFSALGRDLEARGRAVRDGGG
jgi:hypothetical protein